SFMGGLLLLTAFSSKYARRERRATSRRFLKSPGPRRCARRVLPPPARATQRRECAAKACLSREGFRGEARFARRAAAAPWRADRPAKELRGVHDEDDRWPRSWRCAAATRRSFPWPDRSARGPGACARKSPPSNPRPRQCCGQCAWASDKPRPGAAGTTIQRHPHRPPRIAPAVPCTASIYPYCPGSSEVTLFLGQFCRRMTRDYYAKLPQRVKGAPVELPAPQASLGCAQSFHSP